MTSQRNLRFFKPWIGLWLALVFAGCRTIDPAGVTNFATSTTAVKTQANDALNSVAALTRSESVIYAAEQPTLAETNFSVTPTAETITEWDNALSAIEAYAQNLSALLSPDAVKNFDNAATNLFNQFNQTAARLRSDSIHSEAGVNTLLATAFTTLGDAIIKSKEQATALKIATATDTNINEICTLLASEIGSDCATPGLRKTIYKAVWTPALARLSLSFLTAKDADKLALAQRYADSLAKRDAQDQILSSLRRSLLALSDAHHGLAQGKSATLQATLNLIAGEIQHTRNLYEQFSSLNKK